VDQAATVTATSPWASPGPGGTLTSIFPKSRGDAVPAAAQPCFLDAGSPPAAAPCPKVTQPPFSGQQAYYNSGWLPQGASFDVTISATAAPGTYHFRCLVHSSMTGTLQVVGPSEAIPPPSRVSSAGAAQLAQVIDALAPAAKDAAQVTDTAVAGITEEGVTNSFVALMSPPEIDTTVNQAVAWNLYGDHALALNPPEGATGLLTRAPDGTVHINSLAVNRQGGQLPPGGPLTKPVTVSGGTYEGSGFHNSGLLISFPPGLITYTLAFSQPGTYTVRCLVHPAMMATVKVS
jgi:plastocyanin